MSTSSGQAAVGRVRPKAKLVGSRWATAGPRSAVVHGRARDVRLPRNGCRVYRTRYPCCYMLHKMIEGTLHLSRAAGIGLTMLETAEVRMARGATQPLIHPYPKSGLNGKFSGPYAVATALADGHVGLNSFTDESVARSNVQSRLRDIHLIEEGDPMPPGTDLGRMPVTVILKLKDGRVLSHTVRRRLGRRKIQ